jgi:hypothetical protein
MKSPGTIPSTFLIEATDGTGCFISYLSPSTENLFYLSSAMMAREIYHAVTRQS